MRQSRMARVYNSARNQLLSFVVCNGGFQLWWLTGDRHEKRWEWWGKQLQCHFHRQSQARITSRIFPNGDRGILLVFDAWNLRWYGGMWELGEWYHLKCVGLQTLPSISEQWKWINWLSSMHNYCCFIYESNTSLKKSAEQLKLTGGCSDSQSFEWVQVQRL